MTKTKCILVGAPVDSGKRRQGCIMGPDSYRTAGLPQTLSSLGREVEDWGNLAPTERPDIMSPAENTYSFAETAAWTERLMVEAQRAAHAGFPIFLGGDHSLSLGTVAGMAKFAADQDRPFFVLWLDAHTDYHTPMTTSSGNLHGTPLGYVTGREGFEGFPELPNPVVRENICLVGLRSVDIAERDALTETGMMAVDMSDIDEHGIAAPIRAFLERVEAADGLLHVSLDVDFLDPEIAPAVGTTIPGGATFREAHLVMELLHESRRVVSLDLVELNPFLDERGRTASLMVDLTASLLGRRIFDRPTQSFA